MVARVYYKLRLILLNSDMSVFDFDTLLQVKNFMKNINFNENLAIRYELDKVTMTWNMDSGAINQTTEKVVIS